MNILQFKLEEKLAGLPVSMAIAMPQGGWIGPPDQAQLRIHCRNAAALAALAAGMLVWWARPSSKAM